MPTQAERLRGEPLVLDDTGPARRSRIATPAGTRILLLAPAIGLLGLATVWPAAKTVFDSFVDRGRFAGGDNYWNALHDPQLRTDLWNTVVWAVVVPVLLTALGYVFATLSRRVRARAVFTVVLMPMALPLIVTGSAFRLLYDPLPDRGPATALVDMVAGWLGLDVPPLLGPTLVPWALMSAFVWAWVGFAVVVFRTALDDIPLEVEDAVRAEGGGSLRVLRDVHWPFLRKVAAVLLVVFAVADIRTFDLVLMMAPGSVQDEAELPALYLLRQPSVDASGEAAAVAVVWLFVVVVGAILAARGERRAARGGRRAARGGGFDVPWPVRLVAREPSGRRPQPWRQPTLRAIRRPGRGAAVARVAGRAAVGLALVWWAAPVVLLVLTSLHAPVDQAVRGWRAPLSTTAYSDLFGKTELGGALLPTAAMALAVTVAVVVAAALAAYTWTWLGLPESKLVTVVFLAAAVVPIQAFALPLHTTLVGFGLNNTFLVLALVHVGRGIPLAVLFLRDSFAAVPADHLRRVRPRAHHELEVLRTVVVPAAWPAIIAVATLEFILVWNDLVVALLFGGPGFNPVGMVLFGQSRQFVTSASVVAAGSVVVSVLPLLVIVASRRWIVAGLVSGVVRGR
jgi:alpha-glucoside transport system permease protein